MGDFTRRTKQSIRLAQDLVGLALRPGSRPSSRLTEEEDRAREAALVWVRDYIGEPEPLLARSGALCPCTPPALSLGLVTFTVYPSTTELSPDALRRVFVREALAHRRRIDTTATNWELRTQVVVFPHAGEGEGPVLERAWEGCLEPLNERGIMVAVAYPGCRRPALSNENLHPFGAPVGLFVIRPMSLRDIVFMSNRGGVRRYIKRFGTRYQRGEVPENSGLPSAFREKVEHYGMALD